jgi:hypothetical protein
MRSKHMRMRSKRSSYKMRGGAEAEPPAPANNGAVVPVQTNVSSQNSGSIQADMTAGNKNQNSGNIALKGGSSSKSNSRPMKTKQRGGNDNLALYAYNPPAGMMGPIPQPSQTPDANRLILQAAKISTTGQANSVYDKNVNNAPVASK